MDGKSRDLEAVRDTTQLTRWVRRWLYAQIFVAAVAVVSGIFEYRLLQDIGAGVYFTREDIVAHARANDLRQGFVSILWALVYTVGGVTILRWIYYASANAARLSGQRMRYSPAGAVGWYFVPVVNLWKPYQAMKEIWQASAACSGEASSLSSSHFRAWWALWLLSGMVGNAAVRLSLEPKTMAELLFTSATTIVSYTLAIPLSMVFMALVQEIAGLQANCRRTGGQTDTP